MRGDSEEFERVFRAHHDAVLAYALRRSSAEDARDVVAETFLVAWRRFGDAPSDSPLPWLYGVARRVLANQRRAARRRTALVDRVAAAPTASPSETGNSLVGAFGRLPEADREALMLVAWEGLSNEEAAKALGCRTATFRMRVHRARRRLAELLDESTRDSMSTRSMEMTR
ncbi:MAG TPA: RNA polymerase sigma factor [Solirubrobacteraceae bacterium]